MINKEKVKSAMGLIKSSPSKPRKLRNFQDSPSGLSKREAMEEARRCLQCSDPVCASGCPLGIDIAGFIRYLREGEFQRAAAHIREQSLFAGICGWICQAPCERSCIFAKEGKPIAIRALERVAAENDRVTLDNRKFRRTINKKIAVVGSGPAGLMAAGCLAGKGYQVSVLESFPVLGGVLGYGIPAFRLPRKALWRQVEMIKVEGVSFQLGVQVGGIVSIADLFSQGHVAVLLATGSGGAVIPQDPNILLGGVFLAEEILFRANLNAPGPGQIWEWRKGERVMVVGADYPALDCARIFAWLGKEVSLIFPGTEEDLAIHADDQRLAAEEGIRFIPLTRVKELLAGKDHFVAGLKCDRMDFSDPESDGKWTLLPAPDSDVMIETDMVVFSGGRRPHEGMVKRVSGLQTGIDGRVWTDTETGMTSLPGVFACGDITGTCAQMVDALKFGKQAAVYIDQFLQ